MGTIDDQLLSSLIVFGPLLVVQPEMTTTRDEFSRADSQDVVLSHVDVTGFPCVTSLDRTVGPSCESSTG